MESAKIIAIANQKRRSWKDNNNFLYRCCFSKRKQKVLLVDADPQGNLTTSLGFYNPEEMPIMLADLMYAEIIGKEINIHDAILHHEEKNRFNSM